MTLTLSNDYCCTSFGAAVASAAGVYVVDRVVCRTSLARGSRRVATRLTAALLVPLGLAVSPFFKLNEERAFELAFGGAPPPSVQELRAERRYEGGPGDYLILMEFKANRVALTEIISWRGFRQDEDLTGVWHEADHVWRAFVEKVSGRLSIPREWLLEREAPRDLEVFLWWPEARAEGTLLLWDSKRGVAYAVNWLG